MRLDGVDVGRRQPVPLTIGLGIAQKATDSASVAVTAGLASLAALWRCWLWLPALHARTSHRLAGKRA